MARGEGGVIREMRQVIGSGHSWLSGFGHRSSIVLGLGLVAVVPDTQDRRSFKLVCVLVVFCHYFGLHRLLVFISLIAVLFSLLFVISP